MDTKSKDLITKLSALVGIIVGLLTLAQGLLDPSKKIFPYPEYVFVAVCSCLVLVVVIVQWDRVSFFAHRKPFASRLGVCLAICRRRVCDEFLRSEEIFIGFDGGDQHGRSVDTITISN